MTKGGARPSLGTSALYIVALLLLPSFLAKAYAGLSWFYLPEYGSLALGGCAAVVMAFLRSPANRFIAHLWMAWFFLGCLNSLSSFYLIGALHRPALSQVGYIYFAFVSVLFLGMLVAEMLGRGRHIPRLEPLRRELSLPILLVLVSLSLLWAVSLIYFAGAAPILSGADITGEMYTTNYGPLYGYALVVVLGVLALVARIASGSSLRWTYLGLIVVLSFVSIVDGRRVLLVLMLLGSCFVSLRILGARRSRSIIGGMVSAALAAYVFILAVRQGLNFDRYGDGLLSLSYAVGVEFRDFAYTVSKYQPGTIPNYSWATSAAASMVNGGLLSMIGLDKEQLVSLDSARAFATIFQSPYGIRTGVVSELWFAYGWYGLIVIFAVGSLVSWISLACMRAKSDKELVNRATLLALLASLVMGQATAVAGSITVLLYLNIAYLAFRQGERFLVGKVS